MKKLLLKLFVKNYKDVNDPKVRNDYGVLAGVFGIVTNLIVCIVKIVVGIVSASLSILADGINNLSDAGASIVTLIGFKIASKPADEDHPFGHQRMEYLSGLLVSILILMIGGTLLIDSVKQLINPTVMAISRITFIVLIFSIVVKLIQMLFYRSLGKDINSTTLIATGVDSLNDCITTTAVIIGLLIFRLTGFTRIDGIIGLFVAGFIIVSGIKLLKETINPLLGVMPEKSEIDAIANKIKSYDGVLGIHDLIIHNYGPSKTFVSVHVEVNRDVDVMISHDMIDNIEMDFKKNDNINLIIHMDPVDIHDEETQRLKQLVEKLLKQYDERLSFHDFRIVKGVTHTNVVFDIVMPIKYDMTPNELRNDIVKLIKAEDSFLNPVITIDHFYDQNN